MKMGLSGLSVLVLTLVCGCASPVAGGGTTVGGDAASSASGVSVDPDTVVSKRAASLLAEIEAEGAPVGPGTLEVAGANTDDADDTNTGSAAAPQWLELAALRVDVHTAGAMARYEVEHVFFNPSEAQLEGTFRFPLPAGAIVTGLAMEIDGVLMDGEMLERERARQIYEEIVDSMRDPALLEWEAGQQFKLRVFPIEPGEKKRVVMRYMAPLRVDEQAESGLSVEIPSAVPAMQTTIPSLTVTLDGAAVAERHDYDARENLTIPLARAHVPAAIEELHEDQRYVSARVDLDWTKVAAPTQVPTQRRTIIVVDSSRSALESWPLAREAVAALLDSLPADAPFMLLAADLDVRAFADGFVANDASSRAAALEFLDAIEPDGASDLGRMLDRVGELLAAGPESEHDQDLLEQVIYIGDGTPTWGTTALDALTARSRAALAGAPLYAVSVGKHESREVLDALTGQSGGRTVAPKSPTQVASFAHFIEQAPHARHIADVHVELPGVGELQGPDGQTLFEGEQPIVRFRVAADAPLPRELIVRGQGFEQVVALAEPEPMIGARQQFIARELMTLSDKPEIVELSVAHSVLSRHTALLVLESEEAYERYAIERRNRPQPASNHEQAQAEGDPTITGRNLDGDSDPYLGPGDLQPGDPEIHIPAPPDAISVEVVFPFGETKAARWEQQLGQWTVRFLVDDDTAPGTYVVQVRVTHADGRVELLELDYTIDIEAPQLRLELRARDDGAYDVYAHQVLSQADAARERIEGVRADEQAATLDAKRVELLMPDGQTLTLRAGLPGVFVRRWQPTGAVSFPATVTAVVADRALNSRRVELTLAGPEAGR